VTTGPVGARSFKDLRPSMAQNVAEWAGLWIPGHPFWSFAQATPNSWPKFMA